MELNSEPSPVRKFHVPMRYDAQADHAQSGDTDFASSEKQKGWL
jgi:hypothetical protein